MLGRLVEIGSELFAMSAACVRAAHLRTSPQAEERAHAETAVALADLACRISRRRIAARFDRLFDNDDEAIYRAAQRTLAGEFRWLETKDVTR